MCKRLQRLPKRFALERVLLPIFSLQVRCYPECTAKVSARYKKRQPRGGCEAANGSCTTVVLFTL